MTLSVTVMSVQFWALMPSTPQPNIPHSSTVVSRQLSKPSTFPAQKAGASVCPAVKPFRVMLLQVLKFSTVA